MSDEPLQLRPVTRENIDSILALKVREDQTAFVSTTAESLAYAYVYSETAWPFGIYHNEEPVGFIMLGYYELKGYYTLWKLLIDKDHQHKGFGRKALRMGTAFLKERFGISEIYTGVAIGNDTARQLYLSEGFRPTGLTEYCMEELCAKL